MKQIKDLKVGEKFCYCGIIWKAIEDMDDSLLCISSNIILNQPFDIKLNNNFAESNLRKVLNNNFYFYLLRNGALKTDFLDITISLQSNDGYSYYGECTDKITILSREMYLKYCKHFVKGNKWLLATAESCINRHYVRCVDTNGYTVAVQVNQHLGVKPVIRLKKSIQIIEVKGGGYGKS